MEDAALKRGIALWLGYFTGRYGPAGKEIGHANADIIREAAKHHEVGLHAGITMHGKPIAVTGIGKQ